MLSMEIQLQRVGNSVNEPSNFWTNLINENTINSLSCLQLVLAYEHNQWLNRLFVELCCCCFDRSLVRSVSFDRAHVRWNQRMEINIFLSIKSGFAAIEMSMSENILKSIQTFDVRPIVWCSVSCSHKRLRTVAHKRTNAHKTLLRTSKRSKKTTTIFLQTNNRTLAANPVCNQNMNGLNVYIYCCE